MVFFQRTKDNNGPQNMDGLIKNISAMERNLIDEVF